MGLSQKENKKSNVKNYIFELFKILQKKIGQVNLTCPTFLGQYKMKVFNSI